MFKCRHPPCSPTTWQTLIDLFFVASFSPQQNAPTNRPETKEELELWLTEYLKGNKSRGSPNSWDVSLMTDISQLFVNKSFNESLSSWDVSNVKNFKGVFLGAKNFNQPLDSWDVSNATTMQGKLL